MKIIDMKNKWIKNSLDGFNSMLDTAEEGINEMKGHKEIWRLK